MSAVGSKAVYYVLQPVTSPGRTPNQKFGFIVSRVTILGDSSSRPDFFVVLSRYLHIGSSWRSLVVLYSDVDTLSNLPFSDFH